MSREPLRLSRVDFEKTFKFAPRLAVNLLVENRAGEILLTKRNIEPFKDNWHFPGTFLLKNESIDDCIMRLSRGEIGFEVNPKKVELLGLFEDIEGDPRGHVIDAMYKYCADYVGESGSTQETKDLRFFRELPEEIGFNHRDTLEVLGYR